MKVKREMEMNSTKVSVIVPIYNVEKYLVRCLETLIHQTLQEIEIILVDDGSTDSSPKICDEYSKKDSRIKVIHKQNAGLGMARNTGLDVATGEYVGFVDSDDFVDLNTYEKLYATAKKTNAEMVVCNYYSFQTNCNKVTKMNTISSSRQIKKSEMLKLACQLVGKDPRYDEDDIGMSVWKNLYSLQFLRKNNFQFCSEREFLSEDAIFDLTVVPNMRSVQLVTEAYYYYCNNDSESLSSKFRKSRFEEYKKLYLKELDILEKSTYFEQGKYYVATTFLGNIRAYLKQVAASNLKHNEKKTIVLDIINDKIVHSVFEWYPYETTPLPQKTFSKCLITNKSSLVLFLAKIQSIKDKL